MATNDFAAEGAEQRAADILSAEPFENRHF
jgi:hypothetical protein